MTYVNDHDYIKYILTIDENDKSTADFLATVQDKLSPELENQIMGLAEKIELQGIEKGIEKGKLEGINEGILKGKLETAKAMLEEGADIAFVMKVTKLPLSAIKDLQKKIM